MMRTEQERVEQLTNMTHSYLIQICNLILVGRFTELFQYDLLVSLWSPLLWFKL